MAHIRKFGSFMEEYRFMAKQNYYHLLKEAYLRKPTWPTIQLALRHAKRENIGVLAVLFNWSDSLQGDEYWRTIYRKHYGDHNY